MTRPVRDVHAVFEAANEGCSVAEVTRRTGVSRATVREWLAADRTLLLERHQRATAEGCEGGCRRGLDEHSYAYLFGMYLGDGHILRYKTWRTYLLRVFCDAKYTEIIDRVGDAMRTVCGNKIGHRPQPGCVAVCASWNHWPCMFPQHGPGMKHTRTIALEDWQREIVSRHPRPFVKGLVESDGCRFTNPVRRPRKDGTWTHYRYTRYTLSNESTDIKRMFCEALDMLGVEWRVAGRKNISIARRASVAILDEFIGPKS